MIAYRLAQPKRQLGLFDATLIVMGGIVGAGIFANPSEVAHRVHSPALILGVWALGGMLAVPLVYQETLDFSHVVGVYHACVGADSVFCC